MRNIRVSGVLALLVAVAFVMTVGSAAMAMAQDDKPAAEGKISAYEAGKSITVGVEKDKKEFKINDATKVEGKPAVGEMAKVWAKEGTATKIVVEHKK